MTETHLTLDVPTAALAYDVRDGTASDHPTLFAFGSPMSASGFAALASHFPDRRVVTYDPRGADRSRRTDGANVSTPEEHADDLHRVIAAAGGGPIDLFATSGGATNALALMAAHPEDVRLLVAHEPPLSQLLPDREMALAASRDINETYLAHGFGPAMAKFIALVAFEGPLPADYLDRPAPDPAAFHLPTEDDGSRTDPLLAQNMISGSRFQPDIEALRRASTRIVIGIGAESRNQLAGRGGVAIAEQLGLTPVVFPGGHGGFVGPEAARFGMVDTSEAFAARLREVLDSTGTPA
jgi:pimeloyl-ACP methyl ester carboxylesterase